MMNFKYFAIISILIAFLGACAEQEKPFTLESTIWQGANSSSVMEYDDYIKFNFSKDILKIEAGKLCTTEDTANTKKGCYYLHEIDLKYTYDIKTQMFKLENKFNLIKYQNKPAPEGYETGKADSILKLTSKADENSLTTGFKITKDTKSVMLELPTIFVGDKFEVKRKIK